MRIAIIGAGNAGCAHAAAFAQQGHEVSLLKTSSAVHDANFAAIEAQRGIVLRDEAGRASFCELRLATRDPARALEGAEAVFVLVQTAFQARVAERLAPHLTQVRMIMVIPGYMGACHFRPLVGSGTIVGEGESTPIDARIVAPGTVQVLFRNVRNAVAFLPASDAERGLASLRSLIRSYDRARRNIVESALHNPNLIVHTVGTIMSASRIEYARGEFWLYREGFSPSIMRLVEALDGEKLAVLDAFGCPPVSYFEACRYRNAVDETVDPVQAFLDYAASGSPKGPERVNTRFIYEDVPSGLCLLRSLAEVARIPVPVCDALITLGGALLDRDFRAEGRTLASLGLTGRTTEDVLTAIR